MQGRHPAHKGAFDPCELGPAEQYMVAVRGIPRLRERLVGWLFTSGFADAAERVRRR